MNRFFSGAVLLTGCLALLSCAEIPDDGDGDATLPLYVTCIPGHTPLPPECLNNPEPFGTSPYLRPLRKHRDPNLTKPLNLKPLQPQQERPGAEPPKQLKPNTQLPGPPKPRTEPPRQLKPGAGPNKPAKPKAEPPKPRIPPPNQPKPGFGPPWPQKPRIPPPKK